jgi:hypothetical protein
MESAMLLPTDNFSLEKAETSTVTTACPFGFHCCHLLVIPIITTLNCFPKLVNIVKVHPKKKVFIISHKMVVSAILLRPELQLF